MYKILGQDYGRVDAETGDATTTGTLSSFRKLYKVDPPTNPDAYSNKLFAKVYLYIYQHEKTGDEQVELNYNIRIVKNGDAVDPRTINGGGSAANSNEAQDFKYKNSIIDKPKRKIETLPEVIGPIFMQTGDSIITQISTQGISIQAFGEELQYDTDAHFRMNRDMHLATIAKMEEQRQTYISKEDEKMSANEGNADNIAAAINGHQTQYTCNCG